MFRKWIIVVLGAFLAGGDYQSHQVDIRGIYGHPAEFWKKGFKLDELNVNAVFLHHKSIDDSFLLRARTEKQKVFAEFATLNGEGYVNDHPEAWAVDDKGNKVEKATWFMGVCPTDSAFRSYRLAELDRLLKTFQIDGVWLDYLHWHAQFEDPVPILPETCFNGSCLAAFTRWSGIRIPPGSTAKKAKYILTHHEARWRKWRTIVLADWVKACRQVVKRANSAALLGIYHCPWNDTEYDSARIKVLGIDYALLKKEADVFSPMVYHGRMQRSPEWIKENIEWFTAKINDRQTRIWPIVQAYDDPAVVTAKEFEQVLKNGIAGDATGIMMFTSSAVAADSTKTETMRRVYREWRMGEMTPLSNRLWVNR